MGRKQRSGFGGSGGPVNVPFTGNGVFDSVNSASDALGLFNGGATDQWENGLTTDERASIKRYTDTSMYEGINHRLRNGGIDDIKGYREHVDNITGAINKYELKMPAVFHRSSSSSLLGGANSVEKVRSMIGQVVVDKGFTSTTTSYDGGSFFGSIDYHIKTPSGKGIGALVQGVSKFGSGEGEFLFNRGSGFKIVGAYEQDYRLQVNLEYIGRI